MTANAYLVIICDPETNAIKRAEIWSSPEWEQSRFLPDRVFVAYQWLDDTFQKAGQVILRIISQPGCRYHYLMKLMSPEEISEFS